MEYDILIRNEFLSTQCTLQQGFSIAIDDAINRASQMSEDIFQSQEDFEITGNERTEKLGGRKVNLLLGSKKIHFQDQSRSCILVSI